MQRCKIATDSWPTQSAPQSMGMVELQAAKRRLHTMWFIEMQMDAASDVTMLIIASVYYIVPPSIFHPTAPTAHLNGTTTKPFGDTHLPPVSRVIQNLCNDRGLETQRSNVSPRC